MGALIVHETPGAGYGWSTVVASGGEGFDIVRADPSKERLLIYMGSMISQGITTSALNLLRHLDYDHGFDGWRGPARIRDERLALTLRSSLDRLVVYTPPQRDHFCVEPVSHVTNAIHMADPLRHGLRVVPPGGSTEAWMTIEVDSP